MEHCGRKEASLLQVLACRTFLFFFLLLHGLLATWKFENTLWCSAPAVYWDIESFHDYSSAKPNWLLSYAVPGQAVLTIIHGPTVAPNTPTTPASGAWLPATAPHFQNSLFPMALSMQTLYFPRLVPLFQLYHWQLNCVQNSYFLLFQWLKGKLWVVLTTPKFPII